MEGLTSKTPPAEPLTLTLPYRTLHAHGRKRGELIFTDVWWDANTGTVNLQRRYFLSRYELVFWRVAEWPEPRGREQWLGHIISTPLL